MKPQTKISVILILAFVISACGGGGGGASTTASSSISTSPTSYPNVVGHYSFNTSLVSMSCTDGSTASNQAIAMILDITQTDNAITLTKHGSGGSIPGFTVTGTTDLKGNIQKNAQFVADQTTTATSTIISGNLALNYNLSGSFTTTGWSGTYKYSLYSATNNTTCNFSSTFTGDKISSTVVAATNPLIIYDTYNHPIDIHDTFSIFASLVGS